MKDWIKAVCFVGGGFAFAVGVFLAGLCVFIPVYALALERIPRFDYAVWSGVSALALLAVASLCFYLGNNER